MLQLSVFISVLLALNLTHAGANHPEARTVILPLYQQAKASLANNIPDFLRDTYECWSTEASPKDCIPHFRSKCLYDDINAVQAFKGAGMFGMTVL